jgi:prokaryotic YEATS domain
MLRRNAKKRSPGAAMMVIQDSRNASSSQDRERDRDMRRIATWLGLLLGSGLVMVVLFLVVQEQDLVGPLLWGMALTVAGAGIGFLFGIPRVLQKDARAGDGAGSNMVDPPRVPRAKAYEQRVNTNLEEISDWLTKIIVGFGLIELREVPTFFMRLARRVAMSFGAASELYVSAAASIVLLFGTGGFLFGYLITRLYLQGALKRAESHLQEIEDTAQEGLSTAKAAAYAVARGGVRRLPAPENVEVGERWESDPLKGFANGAAVQNGRRIVASIAQIPGVAEVCRVHMEVQSTDASKPLTGQVVFHLHPTFDERDVPVEVESSGVAALDILSWGAFTVGAEADRGATKLELDLSTIPGGTPEFYRN